MDEQDQKDQLDLVQSDNNDLKREVELLKAQMAATIKAKEFADNMIFNGFVRVSENGDIVPVPEEERQGFQ